MPRDDIDIKYIFKGRDNEVKFVGLFGVLVYNISVTLQSLVKYLDKKTELTDLEIRQVRYKNLF